MIKTSPRYNIKGIDFDAIYNRNEYTVRLELKKILEKGEVNLSRKDILDVYALTLNYFPAHYVHSGTIVLFPNVHKQEVIAKLRENIEYVLSRPKA